jgi:hypothetical protein
LAAMKTTCPWLKWPRTLKNMWEKYWTKPSHYS